MKSTSIPSSSVIAAAVVSFVISGGVLLATAFLGIGLALPSQRDDVSPSQGLGHAILIVLIIFWVGMSAFGITVGAGLIRLRNWARISAMGWAVTMILCSVPVLVLAATIPFLKLPGTSTSHLVLSGFFLTIGGSSILVGVWWLILFTRKNISGQFAGAGASALENTEVFITPQIEPIPVIPTPSHMDPSAADPFSRLKGRTILGGGILVFILTIILGFFFLLIGRIRLGRMPDIQAPMIFPLISVCFYGFQLLLVLCLLRWARLRPSVLFGESMSWSLFRGYRVLPVFLVGVSLAGYFILFFPLSYAMPRWIDWYLFQRPDIVFLHSSGYGYHLANVLTLLVVVFFGPIVEELFFRGVLLTRWSLKWNVPRAICLSSVLFGLLHREVIGHIFFGYVMAVLYIETKSLYVPIVMHIANNAIVWVFSAAEIVWGTGTKSTLISFQSSWPLQLALSVIFVPWSIWFISRHTPRSSWKIPYSRPQSAQ